MLRKPSHLLLLVAAVAGVVSSAIAATVLWLLLTEPIRMGQLFGGGL